MHYARKEAGTKQSWRTAVARERGRWAGIGTEGNRRVRGQCEIE